MTFPPSHYINNHKSHIIMTKAREFSHFLSNAVNVDQFALSFSQMPQSSDAGLCSGSFSHNTVSSNSSVSVTSFRLPLICVKTCAASHLKLCQNIHSLRHVTVALQLYYDDMLTSVLFIYSNCFRPFNTNTDTNKMLSFWLLMCENSCFFTVHTPN